MFLYPDPKTIDINGTLMGGQPGEKPTCLIGTIFYENHKILNPDGSFDKSKAHELLIMQESMAKETRLCSMTNVFADTPERLFERVSFVADTTKSPILIDSPDYAVRLPALKMIEDAGLANRIVYNSLNLSVNRTEIEALANSKVESAIVLAYNPTDSSLEGKISFLEKDGAFGKGLLDIAKEAGIKNIMIDTAMTPIYNGAGIALKGIVSCKAKFGWPTGCAMHNSVCAWPWLNQRPTRKTIDIASNMLPVVMGADFIFYGPIGNANSAFDACAYANILVQEAMDSMADIKKTEL